MDKGERYRTIAFFESNGWFGRWVLINKKGATRCGAPLSNWIRMLFQPSKDGLPSGGFVI